MYLLKLTSLLNIRQQEGLGDEPRITVNGNRVYSAPTDSFDTSDTIQFGNGQGIVVPFRTIAEVVIHEEDLGYWPDRHDYIDTARINGAAKVGQGIQSVDFVGDGARYRLYYAVGTPSF